MKWIIACLLVLSLTANAQDIIPFDSPRWQKTGKEVVPETYMGKACLKITNGSAVLPDAVFTNGIIEFDMAVNKARYFPGVFFRMQDGHNTEVFYVRPHQSGNPDALQYYPEYNDAGGWQLYYGDGFGNPREIPVGRWFHIKLLVKDTMAEVYFDNELVLFIKKLYRPVAAGGIALQNEWPETAWYANFTYTATNDVTLISKPKPDEPLPANVVTSWQASSPFDEKLLNKPLLSAAHIDGLTWQTVTTDGRGVVNLDKLAAIQPGKNTVFAKLVIHSDKAGVKRLSFGFSDRCRVYYQDKLLYSGQDEFLSRDYRFLGTMGFYDAVYLDLKKGDNEVWLAISENFGGWGVMARVDEL